jgi:NTP pyrophosphatase (non-canonical NTP hydrolase)
MIKIILFALSIIIISYIIYVFGVIRGSKETCYKLHLLMMDTYKTKMKEFDVYQMFAMETAKLSGSMKINYPTMGLCGESGEVAEKVKKVYRDNKGIFTHDKAEEIAKELGDVLWNLAVLSHEMGFKLSDVAQMNVDKLNSRIERNTLHGNGDNR